MQARPLLVLFVLLLPLSLTAQNSDRVELFGGYSHFGYGVYQRHSGPWVTQGFNGWEASATFGLVPHLGAEVDFAGGSDSASESLRTYMGGPRASANFGKVGLYGHALFGELSFNGAGTASSFAFALGGGADFWFSRHIGARLIQFDYLHNNNRAAVLGFEPSNTAQNGPGNGYRIATGIVFRFGR